MIDDAARWQHAQRLFGELVDLPAPARAAALANAVGDDAALRAEVEALLRGHDTASSDFLEPPILEPGGFGVGAMLGTCRLVRPIGEGGMGSVWLARDTSLDRDVAVKVLHGGLLGRTGLQRFEQEAAVLARLRHPGIAAVYAIGRVDDGPLAQPFFVLELVENAEPITAWADRTGADRETRLHLLAQVADAVQHAHQRGVIHRDLKPGNVLVGSDGLPKVIDFGVARLRDSTDARQTRAGQVLGTPAYLSPEQCSGDPDLVDARTDVHALGLLGCELLTGALPYDVEDRPLAEALQVIAGQAPRRPRSLDPTLGADLDAVLGRAIAKDPADRYVSAAAFADDVRAVLEHRPVAATPPRAWTSVRLFVRRSPALAAALLVAVLALVGGTITSTYFAVRAAERAEIAERERETAQELSDSLRDIVRSGNLGITGRDVTIREALDTAAATIERRFASKPVVAIELRLVLGDAYRVLGRLDDADRQFALANEALQTVPGDRRDLEARMLVVHGSLRAMQNRQNDVLEMLQRAIALRTELHGADDPRVGEVRGRYGALLGQVGKYQLAAAECRAGLAAMTGEPSLLHAEIWSSLGTACFHQGQLEQAEHGWREALRLYDVLAPAEHPHRLKTLGQLANVLRTRAPAEAVSISREVVAATERRFPAGHTDLAQARAQLAFALLELEGGGVEAETEFRAVVALRGRLQGETSRAAAAARVDLGYCLLALGRAAEAKEALTAAWQTFASTPQAAETAEAAGAAVMLGLARTRTGEAGLAEDGLRKAIAVREKAFGPDNPRTHNARSVLGECLLALGRAAEAEPLLVVAEAALAKAYGENHRETKAARVRVVAVREALGRPAAK